MAAASVFMWLLNDRENGTGKFVGIIVTVEGLGYELQSLGNIAPPKRDRFKLYNITFCQTEFAHCELLSTVFGR